MAQDRFVVLNRGVGPGELREAWGLVGGDEFLCRPYVLGCRLRQEIRPVGIFGLLYCFEVSLSGESGETYEGFRAVFLCHPAGFGIFFA